MLPPLFAEALVAACPASSPRFSLVPSPSSAKATGAVSPKVRVAVVTAAMSAERLAPGGHKVARALGVVAIGAGLWMIARAAGLA
jgi:hypothetical protein